MVTSKAMNLIIQSQQLIIKEKGTLMNQKQLDHSLEFRDKEIALLSTCPSISTASVSSSAASRELQVHLPSFC